MHLGVAGYSIEEQQRESTQAVQVAVWGIRSSWSGCEGIRNIYRLSSVTFHPLNEVYWLL